MKILATIGVFTISTFMMFFAFWVGSIEPPTWAIIPNVIVSSILGLAAVVVAIVGTYQVWEPDQ